MKKYKYLIFDADHTLVDFTLDERDALKRIFDENGFAYTEEELIRSSKISLDDWVEMGLTEVETERIQREYHELCYVHILRTLQKTFDELACPLSPSEQSGKMLRYISQGKNLIPNAEETVKALFEKGYIICIATNGISEMQYGRLNRFTPYLHKIFISEEIGTIKPNKRFFLSMLSDLNAEPADCLMIGDSWRSDMAGALGVGMDVCFYNPREGTASGKPTYEINDLKELLTIL